MISTHCIETSQHLKAHRVDDLKIRDNDSVTIAPSYFFLLIVILDLEMNRNIENLFLKKKLGYIEEIVDSDIQNFDMSCFLNGIV